MSFSPDVTANPYVFWMVVTLRHLSSLHWLISRGLVDQRWAAGKWLREGGAAFHKCCGKACAH